MIILKCKMCGGELQITEDTSVCECEYCGSKQTIPTVDDEKLMKLYDLANRLRMSNEFDKAAGVYESIIEQSDTQAEAYWGLLLCKYGIEYVDDPASGNKIPTCHRSSFDSILDDQDFEMVMENSDTLAKTVYRENAKQIDEIREKIIEVSGKEEPYDIFICYKETAENGDRTVDSVMAQDVYDALTGKGYRVFFSRISLEDKIGTEYEPYIFAALNSAKIMLAFGTSYDYYNAVWVKNEWSRYLKLMAKDKDKHLIPCYKDIDAYDMPKEFKHLQAQDMGKIGALQDLLRGIDKILGNNYENRIKNLPVAGNVSTFLERGDIALEDKEWEKGSQFFEDALNCDAKCAEAYLGKMMAKQEVSNIEQLKQRYLEPINKNKGTQVEACPEAIKTIEEISLKFEVKGFWDRATIKNLYAFDRKFISYVEECEKNKENVLASLNEDRFWARARQYAKGKTHDEIEKFISDIEEALTQSIINSEKKAEQKRQDIIDKYKKFLETTENKVKISYEKACKERDDTYLLLKKMKEKAETIADFEDVQKNLCALQGYKDSDDLAQECAKQVAKLKKEERARLDKEREEKHKIKKKRICIIGILIVIFACPITLLARYCFMNNKYTMANEKYEQGDYEQAILIYDELSDHAFRDASDKLNEAIHTYGIMLIGEEKYDDASEIFMYTTNDDDKKYINYCNMIKKLNEEENEGKYINLADILKTYNISLSEVDDLKNIEKNECISKMFYLEGEWDEFRGSAVVIIKDGVMFYDRQASKREVSNGAIWDHDKETPEYEAEFYLYVDNGEIVPTIDADVENRENRQALGIEEESIYWRSKRFNKKD